ncbi:MAG TPA: hypothetical protein RMH99_14365 [Sandaracinaceae bacterium LLY-WYZ-13_1]|nr:hypothetical protein [Sandaracinaceae bacterium LLY-WYZ-13_1]
MAKKSKKELRRERKEREEQARREAEALRLKRRRIFRIAAVVVPVITLAGAIAIYVGMDDRQLAGLLGMVGLAIWVPVLLGLVGSSVKPRDRTRAGSIDFGNKR